MGTFIRTLWGMSGRRLKMNNDIQWVLKGKHPVDFVNLTYGEENHKQLTDLGVKSILLDKKDNIFGLTNYGHKLHASMLAAKEFGSVWFLDWDVIAVNDVPVNFWKSLKGKKFQALLHIYKNPKVWHRKDNRRKVPCGSFYGIENYEIAKEIYDIWDVEFKRYWREECALAKYTDNLMNGFDIEKWKDMFETPYFSLGGQMFPKKKEDITFKHYNKFQVAGMLLRGNIP